MSCFIVGDSLGVGIANQMPDCETIAMTGAHSMNVLTVMSAYGPNSKYLHDNVLISLGSNDVNDPDLEYNLIKIRDRFVGKTVTWLLCANSITAHNIAASVAAKYKDVVLESKPYVGADGVHPNNAGYKALAEQWEKIIK